jgi:hypothetical protein
VTSYRSTTRRRLLKSIAVGSAGLVIASCAGCSQSGAAGDPGTIVLAASRNATPSDTCQRERFVSPDGGTGGDGNHADPWSLPNALKAARPGDCVWLRGGTYSGDFDCRVAGKDGLPIVFRASANEWPVVDGSMSITTGHTRWWGIEFRDSRFTTRQSRQKGSDPSDIPSSPGLFVTGPGTKLINCVIHDSRGGVGFWSTVTDGEIYGCLVYHCGWMAPDRGHGHGLYVQNQIGTKNIRDCIIFDQFGYGIHAYTESGRLDNIVLDGNVVFNSGSLCGNYSTNLHHGGMQPLTGARWIANSTYFGPLHGGVNRLGWDKENPVTNAEVTNNAFVGGTALDLVDVKSPIMTGNRFYGRITGFESVAYPENVYSGIPSSGPPVAVIRPNLYDDGRASIAIYNWERGDEVVLDVSSTLHPGERYRLRNVQDYFRDVRTGNVSAVGSIVAPMTGHTVATPFGWNAPSSTFPSFGAFVLERTVS